ncbi:RelA/SpoT family protein [Salsipaludibacter albus]|uniref:RelA/SpoT family protein n=1 Tax=Salsipaludibacter albus TaxID=2849650 RepID=UPI001EE44C64|nr:bifunctional (p)ppGpp synthetase/guanosine-3',5'-bis(diphosphate) 3'-pyrophosphohydrolase [Salsipaludibacter albus]
MRAAFARLPLVQRPDIPPELTALAKAVREHAPRVDLREVVRAYHYARDAHEGQLRKSGEPYITHPVSVATELATLGFDTDTLVAAILHDVVEDTPATRDEIERHFGSDVALLVDGVTKLDRVHVDSKQHQQAGTYRKMILAMSKDIRVLVIKLADRLHNMSTLEHMPRDKQKRIAQETLDIYAPLAHRLGMQAFKLELEDLGFRTLHPKRYDEIVAMVGERNPEREAYIEEVTRRLEDMLRSLRIRGEITGRPKHYYSIYEKMTVRGREFDEIHDLVGMRVIVDSVGECYALLGQIHAAWRPLEGRFKDYIASPKLNLYQSLHTSVLGPQGRQLEIQIRTRAMHETAEYGVAAHWQYKESARGEGEAEFPWLDALLDWQEDVDDPGDFVASLKHDLYDDEVFVFTPAGDVKQLPARATPIDFAYAIHTEVGHRCVGARVNDRLVALDHVLNNGDVVEILTSKAEDAGPSRDWLEMVASPRAESKIRNFFNRERREDAEERGRDQVTRALRRKGIGWARALGDGTLAEAAEALSYKDLDALMRAVGERHVPPGAVATQVQRVYDPEPDEAPAPPPQPPPLRLRSTTTDDVVVDGDRGMLVHLANCCNPAPGDAILGYITKNRGVSVHRVDCTNAAELQRDPEKLLDVDWTATDRATSVFTAVIEIEAFDRKHLLRDITATLGDLHISITGAQVTTRTDHVAVLRFTFELADPAHLGYAIDSVRDVDGVYDAHRVVPSRG